MIRLALALAIIDALAWLLLFGLEGVLKQETIKALRRQLLTATIGAAILLALFMIFTLLGGIKHG